MKKVTGRMRFFLWIGVFSFLILGVGLADAATATLTITPSPNPKPGDILKFSAKIDYMDVAPTVSVILGGTMWTTELQTVKYSAKGQPATVNFTKTYAVPGDAKSGTSLCFSVVSGGANVEMKQPISDLTCVTVKLVAKIQQFGKVVTQPSGAVLTAMMPDLVIKEMQIDPSNAYVVKAKVANQGGGAAGACTLCVQVRQWSGGASKQLANKEAPVKALNPGEEVWVSVDTGVMGTFFYELTVDCKNVVKESNENNNKATMDRTIK